MWNVGLQGAALAPEHCWVLLMDSGCGAGSGQGSCGFVQKWNCTGGVGVEGFKINPHLHQGPLMLTWAPCRSVQQCITNTNYFLWPFLFISLWFNIHVCNKQELVGVMLIHSLIISYISKPVPVFISNCLNLQVIQLVNFNAYTLLPQHRKEGFLLSPCRLLQMYHWSVSIRAQHLAW